MIIDTEFGQFEMIKDYRDAFDRYTYLVGDMSSGMLRIKGFNSDPKSPNGYKRIPDYLNESCQLNCAHYILKRMKPAQNKLIDINDW